MTPERTPAEIEAEIARLARAIEKESTSERQATRTLAVIGALTALVVLAFVFANYLHLKSEWTTEKLSRGLEAELEVLNPTAVKELQQLGENLLPVYASEARRQFDRLGPELAQSLVQQLEHLGSDLQRDAHVRLTDMEEKIQSETERVVFECYPDLEDTATQERLSESFRQTTEQALAAAITDFDQRFSKDVHLLRGTLQRFDIQEDDEPTVELQKRFISLWLRQLDREIQKL